MLSMHHSQASVASSLVPTTHNKHSHDLKISPTKNKRMLGPWKLGQQLGTGSTCRVILGTNVETNQQAAIKIVNKNHLNPQELSPNEVDASGLPYGIQREIIIMKLLNNKNILKLYDVYESKNHLYLITEYVANGELFDYLVNVDPLPEPQALCVFYELMNGVFFLHNWGIVHRDLKLENILIDSEMHLKIADFGMATLELLKYENNNKADHENNSINNYSDQDSLLNDKKHEEALNNANTKISTIRTTKKVPTFLLETSCGSPHYAAPEVIASLPYNGLKSDMWSCGVIYYALLSGKLPFDDENIKKLLVKVKSGVYEMPDHISEESKELISGLLCSDPEKRWDAEGVLKCNLFRKYNIGFYSSDPELHNYYNNINVFTNSINQNLIKTNKDDNLIINNYNFSKKIKNDAANLDEDILEHLLILYHHKKEISELIQNLVNDKVNIDKVFYSLLIGFDHNSTKFITKKNTDFEDDIDNIGSFPATLKMNHSKMTKTYSNISIVVSQNKRNISFKGINTRSSSMKKSRSKNQHSLYKYSQKGLKSSKSLLQKSSKSINSVYNPSQMRPSHSMASYNGSTNLSQYLSKDFHMDYEFEDEEDLNIENSNNIVFHDEPVNVLSPGVPISYNPFDESPIKELTSTYNRLQISETQQTPKNKTRKANKNSSNKKQRPYNKDNSDFVNKSNAKLAKHLDDDFSFESKPNLKLAKEFSFKGDYTALDSPINYRLSPKRNKRYKTSGYATPEILNSPTGSPIKYKRTVEKTNGKSSRAVKSSGMPHRGNIRSSGSSRRTIKSTLSSKVMSNYAKINEGYTNPGAMYSNYLDSSTKETKSEFELICDQMFSKSSDNYNNLFGENYFDRKAKEAQLAGLLEKQKREEELERKREKERSKKAGRLNINVNPISRLDPGLYNDNTDTSSNSIFLNDDSFDTNLSNNYSSKKNTVKISNEDVHHDSSVVISNFDNEEFSELNPAAYGSVDVLGLSYNNTSATTEQVYSNNNSNPVFGNRIGKETPRYSNHNQNSSFVDSTEDFEYVTKSSRPFSNDRKLLNSNTNANNVKQEELFPAFNNENLLEIPKKNKHLDSTYHKKSFLASEVQFTDISNSPFRKDAIADGHENKDGHSKGHLRKVSSSLTEQVIKDENLEGKRKILQISSNSETPKSNFSGSSTYFNNNKNNVRVFTDKNESLNLITNGNPGSSKNLVLQSHKGNVNSARHSVDGSHSVKRKSSILRRFSLNGNSSDDAAAEEKPKVLTTVKEIKIETNNRSQHTIEKTLVVVDQGNVRFLNEKLGDNSESKVTAHDLKSNKRPTLPISSPSANEFSLTLPKAQSIIAIRSLLYNWKKYGVKNIRVQNNVVTGSIKNPHRKFFSLSPATGFKIILQDEGGSNSKLEICKTKGSDKVFDRFVEEFLQVLIKEKVFKA